MNDSQITSWLASSEGAATVERIAAVRRNHYWIHGDDYADRQIDGDLCLCGEHVAWGEMENHRDRERLRAALVEEGVCATCGGMGGDGIGRVDQMASMDAGAAIRVFDRCRACGGSGTSRGGGALIPRSALEHIAWRQGGGDVVRFDSVAVGDARPHTPKALQGDPDFEWEPLYRDRP